MEKQKKEMSIATQMFLGKILAGILWIGAGITGMFDNIPCDIIHIICLAAAVVIVAILLKVRKEEDDEMSQYNYTKAKATTTTIMNFIYCICALLSAITFGLLQNADLNWPSIIARMFFVLMGIQDLITGITFRRLEDE